MLNCSFWSMKNQGSFCILWTECNYKASMHYKDNAIILPSDNEILNLWFTCVSRLVFPLSVEKRSCNVQVFWLVCPVSKAIWNTVLGLQKENVRTIYTRPSHEGNEIIIVSKLPFSSFLFYWDFNYKSPSVFPQINVASKCHIDLITIARALAGLWICWRFFYFKNCWFSRQVTLTFKCFMHIRISNIQMSGEMCCLQ